MEILCSADLIQRTDFQKHWIPLYSGELACGLFGITDDFVESYLSLDEKFTRNKESCFFIRASGDSMEPQIYNSDILVVDCSIAPRHGAIIAVFYNNNPLCKQLVQEQGKVILRSLNSKYKDVVIKEEDDFKIFGTVIGLARDFR